jgi:hypothetical protein
MKTFVHIYIYIYVYIYVNTCTYFNRKQDSTQANLLGKSKVALDNRILTLERQVNKDKVHTDELLKVKSTLEDRITHLEEEIKTEVAASITLKKQSGLYINVFMYIRVYGFCSFIFVYLCLHIHVYMCHLYLYI